MMRAKLSLQLYRGVSRNEVQFSTFLHHAHEGSDTADDSGMSVYEVGIIRSGDLTSSCSVTWTTIDPEGSFKNEAAGILFVEQPGEVVQFEPGEYLKKVKLHIIPNESYDSVAEAVLFLRDCEHCEMSQRLACCRVKIIDDDVFPTNKYMKEMRRDFSTRSWKEGKDWNMFIELVKLLWKASQPGAPWVIAADFVENIVFVLRLELGRQIIKIITGAYEDILEDVNAQRAAAVTAASILFGLEVFLHLSQYRRQFWKVGGKSRKLLLSSLMQRFLYYSEVERDKVDNAQFRLTFAEECFELVVKGYMKMFAMLEALLKVFLIAVFFVYIASDVYSDKGDWQVYLTLVPILVMPILIHAYLKTRALQTRISRRKSTEAKAELLHHMTACVDHQDLISENHGRPLAMSQCGDRINLLNSRLVYLSSREANDDAMFGWMAAAIEWIAIVYGTYKVLEGGFGIATYTAILGGIKSSMAQYRGVYNIYRDIQSQYPGLWHLVQFMNIPTDLMTLHDASHEQHRSFERKMEEQVKNAEDKTSVWPADGLIICVKDVEFRYSSNSKTPTLTNLNLEFEPGTLCAITGPPCIGLKTALRVISGIYLPQSGHVFVPGHLRCLYVNYKQSLWSGPIGESLFFGILTGHKRLRLHELPEEVQERGFRICKRLRIHEEVIDMIKDSMDDQTDEVQADDEEKAKAKEENFRALSSLPATTICKIQLAAALIDDPEVLVLNKALQPFAIHDQEEIMKLLREHVEERGLEHPREKFAMRRTRTVIFASKITHFLQFADVIYEVSPNGTWEKRSPDYIKERGRQMVEAGTENIAHSRSAEEMLLGNKLIEEHGDDQVADDEEPAEGEAEKPAAAAATRGKRRWARWTASSAPAAATSEEVDNDEPPCRSPRPEVVEQEDHMEQLEKGEIAM